MKTKMFYTVLLFNKMRKVSMGTIYGDTTAENTVFLLAIYFWTVHMFTGGLRTSWMLIFFTFLLMPSRLILMNRVQFENTQMNVVKGLNVK